MQKSIQFSQWGVCETLYQTSFSNTTMKFLNSWPNSLHCLAETRLPRLTGDPFCVSAPKNGISFVLTQQNTFALTFVESPSSTNGL